ncbi:MAG TPA: phosphatidylglycerophosphatase A [Bryobacteraceae bacterium]|nr:phosphatidylglycerophosphatase A [Bryobacteraceae bacterium]
MKRGPAFWFATWFGCGLAPKAPGTFGSLGALIVAWPLIFHHGWQPLWFGGLAIAILYPAIQSATSVSAALGRKDPQIVVVDEVVGQWLTLAGATRLNPLSLLYAFILFRLFDIWKPPPVRRLEQLPAGTGIVLDDAMAGIYGAVILYVLGKFNIY